MEAAKGRAKKGAGGEGKKGRRPASVVSADSSATQSPATESPAETTVGVTDEGEMCGLSELVSHCLSSKVNREPSEAEPFLRNSLFSNVPPTVRFYTKGTNVSKPSKKISTRLTWCYNSLLPIVMRHSLAASHFKVVDENSVWIGYWGRHLKSAQYKNIRSYQKVNHFPGAFHIGRKDRLWMHVEKCIERWGEEYFILPITYILPKDHSKMVEYLESSPQNHLILKPPASARGTGISVTRKLKDVPTKQPMIAQHYVHRPLTINGAKFDLRLYAYIPSLEPLRVYIYDEGLVRFASVPYSHSMATVSNKYMHLTNYSINKLAEKDGVSDAPVPKWTLTHLWRHFDDQGIDSVSLRAQIEDVIVKAVIACEKPIRDHMVKHLHYGFVCHELFGVDILLDEDMRPWLLELNISPSLHSGTPLDISVKAPLAKDVLNLAGIHVPTAGETDTPELDIRSRPRNWPKPDMHLEKERGWEESVADERDRARAEEDAKWEEEAYCTDDSIVSRLTSEDVKMLVEFEDEQRRRGAFRLVFPTHNTQHMQKYFAEPVYANLLLQHWQLMCAGERRAAICRLEKQCRLGFVDEESDEE